MDYADLSFSSSDHRPDGSVILLLSAGDPGITADARLIEQERRKIAGHIALDPANKIRSTLHGT